jgi:hypothetical protein
MTTSNSEQQLDPLTRIVQKRRRDCETLDKAVIAALIEVPWTEYTSQSSSHATASSIKDPRDRLQWLLTVYLDQAGKDKESTSNRRKAWNVLQGLVRKIDELLETQSQTVAAHAQPSSPTASSALISQASTAGAVPPNAAGAETTTLGLPTSHVGVGQKNASSAATAAAVIQTRWGPRATTTATSKVINAPAPAPAGTTQNGWPGPQANNLGRVADAIFGETNGADRGLATTRTGISQQTTRKEAPTQATATNGKGNGVSNGASTHITGQAERQASSVPGSTNPVDSSQVPLAAARSGSNAPTTQEQSRGSYHSGPQQPVRRVASGPAALQNGVGNRSLTNGSSHEGLMHRALGTPQGRALNRNTSALEQPRDSNHLERSSLPANSDLADPSTQALKAARQIFPRGTSSDRVSPAQQWAHRNTSASERLHDSNYPERNNSSRSSSPYRNQSGADIPVWDPRIQFEPPRRGGNDSTSRPAGGAQGNQQGLDTPPSEDPSETRSTQAQRLAYSSANSDESNRSSHAQSSTSPTALPASPRLEQSIRAKSAVLTLLADNAPTISGSIKERDNIQITVAPRTLVAQATKELITRSNEGDPFWCIQTVVDAGVTSPVSKPNVEAARTAARIDIDLSNPSVRYLIPSVTWGEVQTDSPKDGDVALVLRMLPLGSNGTNKRADCHLWPKGTFLQLDGNGMRLTQRRQQSHDLTQWKGMCKHLDVTEHISDPKKVTRIQLCCYDDQPYLYCLAFCKFRSPNAIYHMLMNPAQNWTEKLSREEGFQKAIQYVNANGQMVVLDSDNESEPEVAKLIFSLICPISKTLMQTPVRGKSCKHWQVRTNQYRLRLKEILLVVVTLFSKYLFYSALT